MKNFNKKIFSLNISSLQKVKSEIPQKYYDIANDDEIFIVKENIRVLNSELENVALEYDYLSSAERLLEFQFLYFEDELIQKNIKDIKIYNILEDTKKIQDFKIIKE